MDYTDTQMGVTVSVIIPTHNRPQQLQNAVQSVLAQTFQDFELIIIDDASKEAIAPFKDKRIHLIRNEISIGGSASRNRGVFLSRGKWIAFLDDDDTWKANKLELQLKMLARHPHAIACSTAYTVHYPLGYKRHVFTPSHVPLPSLLRSNCLGGASVCLCDSQTLKQLNGFNLNLSSAQDWDIWLKLRLTGDIVAVAEPLVDYFVHFNERISNNMRGKYQGARLFYFTYKAFMSRETQLKHLQFICFIKSRSRELSISKRLKNLRLAIKKNHPKTKIAYVLSSLPRMFTKRL